MDLRENYLVDDKGNTVAVQLPIKEYDKMREAIEELEDIKAYEKAKAKKESTIPLRKAIKLRRKKHA